MGEIGIVENQNYLKWPVSLDDSTINFIHLHVQENINLAYLVFFFYFFTDNLLS